MFITSQVLGVIAAIFSVISIQFKEKKNILLFFALANVMYASSFILLDGYSGTIISIFCAIQTMIVYKYEIKNMKTPKTLIPIYLVISAILGFITYKTYIDILPIISSVLFTFVITQEKEKNIRKITVLNVTSWIIYTMFISAYTSMIFNILFTISTIIAIIRYDIIKKENKE